MKLVCIYDRKAEMALSVVAVNSVEQARRQFVDLLQDGDTLLSKHPEDYSLYELADWNPDKMIIEPCGLPTVIEDGINVPLAHSPSAASAQGVNEEA